MATIEERIAAAKKGQKAGTQGPAGSVQDRINRAKGSGATQSASPRILSALQKRAEQQTEPVAVTPMSQSMGVASFGKQMMGQTPSAVLGGGVNPGFMTSGEIRTAHGRAAEEMDTAKADHERLKLEWMEQSQGGTTEQQRQEWHPKLEAAKQKQKEAESKVGKFAGAYYTARGEELSKQLASDLFERAVGLAMQQQGEVDKVRYGGNVGPDWSFLFGGEDAGGVSMSALQQLEKIKEQFVAAGWSREDIDRAIDYQVKTRREKAAQEEQKALQEKLAETEGKPVYRGGVGPDYSYLFGGESKNGVVTKQVPKDKGVDESVLAALSAPAQALDFINMRIATAGRNNIRDIDGYKPASAADMPATVYANTVMDTVSKRIEGEKPTLISKAAAFLYQTGMSMAQSTALAAGLGPFSLAVMGGSAAASSALDVIERGGTNNQAFAAGIASGVAEVLFEKFSVENLLKGVGDSTFFKSMLKQAGIEASEEMATEIANILSDAVIMGRDSRFEESVRAYMDEGMSREQAEQKAFLDCVGQVALAGLGGALSGGGSMAMMGGGQLAIGKAVENARAESAMQRKAAAGEVFDRIEQQKANGQKKTASEEAGRTESGFRKAKILTDEEIAQIDARQKEAAGRALEQAVAETAAQGRQRQAQPEQGNNPSVSSADTSPYTGEAMGAPAAQVSAQGTTAKTDTAARTNAPAASQGAKPKMGVVDARTAKDAASLRNVLSDREVLYLDWVAQAADIRINIVDAQYGEGAADGWYENGEIYLTENCEDPVAWVVTHELTHYLERAAPEAYRQYQEYVKKILTDEGGLEEQIARIRQHYAERNVDLTEEGAMRELAANFTERLRLDEDLFRRIAGENRNLAQRLLDSLKEFIRKVRRKLSGKQLSDLERTRQAWERALKESRGKTVETGERQYAFKDKKIPTYDELVAKPDLKVVDIRGAGAEELSLKGFKTSEEARALAKEPVVNKDTGETVFITAKTFSHSFSGVGANKVMAARNIREIVENAVLTHAEPSRNARSSEMGVYTLFGAVLTESGVQPVKVKIKEYSIDGRDIPENVREVLGAAAEGNFASVYDNRVLVVEGIEKEGSDGSVLAATPANGVADRYPSVPSEISIKDLMGLVNSEYQKYLPQKMLSGADRKDYSLRGARDLEHQVADLQKQNARLQARNEELRSRLESGGAVKVDEAEAKRMAKQLLKDFSSGYDAKRLAERLRAFYDKAGGRGAVGPALRQEAEAIARDVLAEVSVMGEAGTALRETLRSTKIHVPRELWDGFENEGGYNTFRQKYMGRLQLNATEGRSIDEVYEELSLDHPELFDMDGITDPVNRLLQIAEVADSLRFVSENLSAADRVNVELLSGEIMERFYDLAQKDLPYTEGRARDRGDAQKRLRESLAKRERESARRIENIRKSNREAAKRAQERMSATKLRDSIRKHADALSRKLTRPTDKQHIPERLQGSVLALLEVIDLESKYGYRFTREATFRRVNVDEDGHLEPTARTTAARALKAAYEELRSDPEFNSTVDPDLADMLEEIAEMGDIRVADMNLEQLQTVWRAVRAVEASVTKSDKMLGASKFGRVSAAADALKAEMGDRKDRKNLVGALGRVDQLLNLDMLTPETFLHRMGRVGEDIHDQMRRAQDKNVEILKEGVEFYKRTAAETGVDMLKAEKDMHTFKVSGGTIELTTAQVMELYALSKRQAAMEHIYKGGIRAQGGRKGLVETGQSKAVRVTFVDVADILGVLTPEQKKFVDTLQGYMSTRLAAHGNEASMEVYDYEKFKEKAYWPIKVSKTETDTDPAAEARAKTIPGFGMTKTLKPHASNSVMLRSALDSFGEHLNQMATYAAWLTTSENITKLINYDFMAEGVRTGTVKDLLLKIYGKGGEQYLADLMSDVAQGTKTGSEKSALTDSMFGRWKAAKVGANIRVVLQQPTAILRAAEMIDPKYMAAAGNPMKGWRKAAQWAPIAQWKDWGYFELDAGRSMRELMAGTDSKLDKVKNASMWAAGKMDNVAWGMLWNAVEAETKAKRSDLKAGSDDFYKAVAKRFGEVVDRTQVVDSVLHRTQIMRSSNALNRMATSFMSEPSKIYNMVARDIYDIRNAEKGSAEHKRAWKHVARTGVALVASFAVNAVAQSIADALRDDDRDKKYLEKLGDAYLENFLQNFDPFGYLPYVKDVESLIQGFTVDRPDMEGLADLVNAAKSLGKAVSGEGNKTMLNAGFNAACKALDAFGLPASNVKRDLAGIFSTTLQAFGAHEIAYRVDKLMLKTDASGNAGAFYDTLYRAMNDDYDAYVKIYNDMVKEGVSPDNIMSAMEKRMAAELGLTKTVMLPTDWYAPGKNKQFDEMLKKQLEDGKTWANAADPDMVSLAIELEALQPEEGKSSVSNQQRMRAIADSEYDESVKELAMERVMTSAAYSKYIAARDAGVSTYAYMDLLEDIMAETVARRGESGSASQDDVLNALKKSGLTNAQKRAVWYSYGYKSESPWG